MFRWWFSWRLKKRQRTLALAWCGNQRLADWLLAECHPGATRLTSVEIYQHMAHCWLRYIGDTSIKSVRREGAAAVTNPAHSANESVSSRVRHLICRMPMPQRMTLSLVDIAGLGYRETATVMGIGLFEVQYHIVIARRQLVEAMCTDSEECPYAVFLY